MTRLVLAVVASAFLLSACTDNGGNGTNRVVEGNIYPHVTSTCDHGNRVYVTEQSMQGSGGGIFVVAADPTCGGAS